MSDQQAPQSTEEIACMPPPPPEPTGELPDPGSRDIGDTAAMQRFWLLLQKEAFRHRGGGFRGDWAFHMHAIKNSLGAACAPSSGNADQLAVGSARYGYQVMGGDMLFNEIPNWSQVQSLNQTLGGQIPASGVGRQMLERMYQLGKATFHADWAFHQVAVREKLGMPFGEPTKVNVGGQDYNVQAFAGDTLYTPIPNWSDVRLLSACPAGELRDKLAEETCKATGVKYTAGADFTKFAIEHKLGAPLSAPYNVDFEGVEYPIQVFARDTIYLDNGKIGRQSDLPRPAEYSGNAATPAAEPVGSREDALANKRQTFTMLPIAGQPRISQFYGYTKWAAGGGRQYYGATQGRHSGIDIWVPVGTALLSIGYGVVLCAGTGCPFGASLPQSIVVRFGDTYAIYGHASSVTVRKGQFVGPGDLLGYSGDYGGPHLHFELRMVPASVINNTDPNQAPVNPGTAFNPVERFSSDLQPYFQNQLNILGGTSHFCVGSFNDQAQITFGAAVDTRGCTN